VSDPTNLIFSDTFTEAAGNPLLTAHTPDTGSGWTKLLGDAGKYMYVPSASDRLEVSSDAYNPFGYTAGGTYNADQAAEAVWSIDQLNNGAATSNTMVLASIRRTVRGFIATSVVLRCSSAPMLPASRPATN